MKKYPSVIPLVLLVCFVVGCQKQVEEGITEEEAKAIHNIYVEARNTVKLDLLDQILANDVVVHDSGYPEDIVGLDALKEYYSNNHKAFPDMHFSFSGTIAKGDRVVVFWTMSGTNTGPLHTPLGEIPATGRNVQFSGIAVDRLEDGKIVEEWAFWNVLDLMQQLGFMISPPQFPQSQD